MYQVFEYQFLVLMDRWLGVGLLDHMIRVCLTQLKTAIVFQSSSTYYIPISSMSELQWFCVLSSSQNFLMFIILIGNVVVSQCNLICISLMVRVLSIFSCSYFPFLYPFWASLVSHVVKNLPAMRESWIRSLGCEDALEKGMATHSSILAWRIP